jgi:hypothetical protein
VENLPFQARMLWGEASQAIIESVNNDRNFSLSAGDGLSVEKSANTGTQQVINDKTRQVGGFCHFRMRISHSI